LTDNLPADRQPGTRVIDTEACIELLKDIVANADNQHCLRRHLFDEFKPESYLSPRECLVPAALIEGAMKALGWPYPKAPKPRKVPDVPTPAQAAALEPLNAEDAKLVTWYNRSRRGAYILVGGRKGETVREPTVSAMLDYKWIEKVSDNPWGDKFYNITQAGRDALARYQAKKAA
jgi:hypothetical protein